MKSKSQPQAEAMTTPKVDFSFRIYWTKMSRKWSAARRAEVRAQVQTITTDADFDRNLIEKRYDLPLADVPESTHSGASLMALLDVLDALDTLEAKEKDNT
jgi:hypothetical protein